MSNNIPKLQWQTPRGGPAPQPQTPQPASVSNYTLPGVINYLTSEFTNLERFKIMTNLEKSEMKYRITQLQGELNAMKYVNEQQKARIAQLEAQVGQKTPIPAPDADVSEVDLELIKNSRLHLTKSMREVIHLLKTPTAANLDYLNLPDVNDSGSFDELFNHDKLGTFTFSDNKSDAKGYFAAGASDILDDSSVRAKFDDISLDTAADPVESDAETVVLDGGNELKFDTETGALEPTIDLEAPPHYKLSCDLDLALVADTANVRVFNNHLSDVLVFMNYDPDSPDNVTITLYSVDQKAPLLEFTSSKSNFDDIDGVLDVYCLKYDVHTKRAHLLLVSKSGEVNQLVLDDEDPVTTLVLNLATTEGGFNSSSLIEFKHKSTDASLHFGLVITMSSKSAPSFRVYELVTGPRNSLTATEIGSYTRAFFKSIKTKDSGQFQVVKWFVNRSCKEVAPSKVKKSHKKSPSCSDVSLSPYQVVLKLDTTLLALNIVSSSFSVISDYTNGINPGLESNVAYCVVASEIDKTSFQLEVCDLSTSKNNNIITVEEPLTDDKSFTVVSPKSTSDFFIVVIANDSLSLYTKSFKKLDSHPVHATKAFIIGDSIAIQSKSSLTIYSLRP